MKRIVINTLLPVMTMLISSACNENGHHATIFSENSTTTNTNQNLLEKWCSECHAPPEPAMHTPQEWPAVVYRMQEHRIRRAMGSIPKPALNEIIVLLQDNAAN